MNKIDFDNFVSDRVQRIQAKHQVNALNDTEDLRWSMVSVECFKLGYKLALSSAITSLGTHVVVSDEIEDVLDKKRNELQKKLFALDF